MQRSLVLALVVLFGGVLRADLPGLRVAADQRHLETVEGKPFFLLGDTAWELFHRLTREETARYLDKRAAQGFNTVLAVALAEFEFDQPNAYGEMPLAGIDPAQPRDAYFQHVDWVINEAARRGIYTALLPTWGDKWNKKWGKGPEIFTPENAADYGEWLDFHMFQSGHGRQAVHNFDFNAKNLTLAALKPTLDGEPNYEDHPVRGLMKDGKPTIWFDDHDVRRAAWWSLLSGACGHVYGTHSIWQFHDPEKRQQLSDARTPWQQALDLPGAVEMGVMKKFFEAMAWTKLRRDDAFITAKPQGGWKADQVPMAAVADDGSFAVAYLPDVAAGALGLDFGKLKFAPAEGEALVVDPVSGEKVALKEFSAEAVDVLLKEIPKVAGKAVDRVVLIRKAVR